MNKNVLLALNIVLSVLVGVLFYLHFSTPSAEKKVVAKSVIKDTSAHSAFNIAYFEMDSIENNYTYLKEVKDQLKMKENDLTAQLSSLKNRYIDKVNKFKQEAETMTQERQSAMQQDLMQEQDVIRNKEQDLGSQLQEESYKKLQVVNQEIEAFLKEYNEDKGYSYILAYQPGTIYYKDARYDITGDVLQGLNERFKSRKKKK